MYLGLVLCLLGWAVLLGGLVPFIVIPAFFVLISFGSCGARTFMAERFGQKYASYRARVRAGFEDQDTSGRPRRERASAPKRATCTTSAAPAGSSPRSRAPGLRSSKLSIVPRLALRACSLSGPSRRAR